MNILRLDYKTLKVKTCSSILAKNIYFTTLFITVKKWTKLEIKILLTGCFRPSA